MGAKIGIGTSTVNTAPEPLVPQALTLVTAIVALLLWVILTFILKTGSGAIHLLLALGATLLVRWIALRNEVRN